MDNPNRPKGPPPERTQGEPDPKARMYVQLARLFGGLADIVDMAKPLASDAIKEALGSIHTRATGGRGGRP